MPIITLQNIVKTYKTGAVRVKALRGISVDIEDGEMVAVMGPSGSGKSTLMNIIGLLDRPTEGQYLLENQEISLSMSDRTLARLRSERIGFVFQSFNLLPEMSSLENVLMPTTYSKIRKTDARLRAEELLDQVGLAERLSHRPSELSGGEKQRVAVARALINDPDIILADEPTGNLDTKTGTEIINILRKLHQEGKTIIVITHDQAIANACERVVRMVDGKVVEKKEESGESLLEKVIHKLI